MTIMPFLNGANPPVVEAVATGMVGAAAVWAAVALPGFYAGWAVGLGTIVFALTNVDRFPWG